MSSATGLGRPRAASIAATLALSWLGLYLHNLQELALPLWRPENSVTLLIAASLAAAWWRWPRRWLGVLLIGWVVLQLIGGAVLSVLPLGLYPFEPEQSLSHYGSHLLYGLAQIPLLWVALRTVTTPTTSVAARSAVR